MMQLSRLFDGFSSVFSSFHEGKMGGGHYFASLDDKSWEQVFCKSLYMVLQFTAIIGSVPQRGTRIGSPAQARNERSAGLMIIAYRHRGDPRGHTSTVCAAPLSTLRAFARESYPCERILALPFSDEEEKKKIMGRLPLLTKIANAQNCPSDIK